MNGLVDRLLATGHAFAAAGGHDAAASTSTAADWVSDYKDPNWLFAQDGAVIGARSEDGQRNNPVISAAVESMLGGTLGEAGLTWHSQYARDDAPDTDAAENQFRDQMTAAVKRATSFTRFDADGHRTWRELLQVNLATTLHTGNGLAVRVSKPNRPGRQVQSTCVRLVHTSRLGNPGDAPDTDRLIRGLELDGDGAPVAIHVRRYRADGQRIEPVRVPIYDAAGTRQVTWLKRGYHPDQLFGTGWLGPVLSLLRQFGMALDAYVVAKRIQACFPAWMESDDVKALAAAKASKTLIGPGYKWKPGQVAALKSGTNLHLENLTFNGADHQAFGESLLQLATAALGLPYEVVINRLSKSNLAAARAALLSAYRAFRIQQHDLINQVLVYWVQWILEEELARGRLVLPTGDDTDRLVRGKWTRPAVPTPDLKKDIEAAQAYIDMGGAPSTAFAMIGQHDHQAEIRQHASDLRDMRAQGVKFGAIATAQGPAAPKAPTDPADDGEVVDEPITDDTPESP